MKPMQVFWYWLIRLALIEVAGLAYLYLSSVTSQQFLYDKLITVLSTMLIFWIAVYRASLVISRRNEEWLSKQAMSLHHPLMQQFQSKVEITEKERTEYRDLDLWI